MELTEIRKSASLQSKGDSSREIKNSVLQLVRELAAAKSPQKVLDLGCGRGELLGDLKNLFPSAELWGSDLTNFNPGASYQFVGLDLNEQFSSKLGKFDLVTCLEVIEHLENPRHLVRELGKCLNPGGQLVISTPNPESWTSILSFIFRGYHNAFGGKCYPAHITPVPVFDLQNMFREAGDFSISAICFVPNGRLPKLDIRYSQLLPILRGKRYSDNYILVAKKI